MARRNKKIVSYQPSDDDLVRIVIGLDKPTEEEQAKAIAELEKKGIDIEEAEKRLRSGKTDDEKIDDNPLKTLVKKQWPLVISFLSFIYLIYISNDLGPEGLSEISTKLIVIASVGFIGVLLYVIRNSRSKKR